MTYTVRDYQGRVNGIFNRPVLVVDGVSGPKTRKGIADAMQKRGVRKKQDLFTRGVRGVVWHWTAGANGFIELEKEQPTTSSPTQKVTSSTETTPLPNRSPTIGDERLVHPIPEK